MTRVERPTWRRSILVAVVLGVLVSAAAAQAPSTEAAESTDRLVFMRLSDAGTGADPRVGTIHTVGTDGSDLSDLGSGWSPVWSPDGHRIAFSDQLAGGSFEIFVMDADGSNRRRVTTSPVDDVMPTWSPTVGGSPSRGRSRAARSTTPLFRRGSRACGS